MVQAWYQGGISVFDFTDSANPVEIAFFDRGPINPKELVTGGYWSAYWYNGNIYGAEIARGIDVFRLLPSEYLTQNEIDAADAGALRGVQRAAPAEATCGRRASSSRKAYLDQLTRSNGIPAARLNAVKSAIDRADRNNPDRAAVAQLDTIASQLEQDAATASGRDADRLRALAATIKGRAARLRG